MYLKSIEVHGFKSFANKIIFQFQPGITGIVGPNGSGKSNVADAVRWVLGEQRIKQLRGASMQDVIFSGTENRKPLGYAYVAITLDNSDHSLAIDFDEVKVARRIYRSGESEYLINDVPSRLKDVNELFYDTGIGKEGYSIIGQGQIDKILSGKPEERRELFDEAAGIVKFKRRKLTAQKKLEDEKANMLRISDILTEKERLLGPLEKQSEKAKIYLKHKEDLKTLDVNIFLLENAELKSKLDQVDEKLKIASGDLEEATKKYESIKLEYDQVAEELSQLEVAIEEERAFLSSTGVIREKLEGQINLHKEQIHALESNQEHFRGREKAIQAQIDAKDQEKEDILSGKKTFDDQLAEMEQKKAEAKAELDRLQNEMQRLNSAIESGNNTLINIISERAAIKSKMGSLETRQEQAQIRKAELNSKLLSAKSDEVKQDELIAELEATFEKISAEITELREKQDAAEKRNSEISKELSEKDAKFRETQQKYHQAKSKLEAINNISERYEGYGGSIRHVMEQKERNKGIIGVVADIIKVEKAYEIAIETALGGNIQNIVTEDVKTAKAMVEYLKTNRYGRATFLPLTSIDNPKGLKSDDVLDEEGVVGLASELVKTEDKYYAVAKFLLGRIVVVDTFDHAAEISKKYNRSLHLVTLEGEYFAPGGSISGGAFKNTSNLLSRRREIDELEKQVKDFADIINQCNKDIEDLKAERNRVRMDGERVRMELQQRLIAQNTARISVETAKEKKLENGQDYESLKEEQVSIEEQLEDIAKERENATLELSNSETKQKETEESVAKFQSELEVVREDEMKQAAKNQEMDLQMEKVIQRQSFEQQNLDRILEERHRFEMELAEIRVELDQSAAEVLEKTQNIEEIKKTIEVSFDKENENEIKLANDITRREALLEKQKNFFNDREALAEQKASLDKEVFRLTNQKERFEENLEGQINYMWAEYEITLSDAAGLRNEEMTDLTVLKRDAAEVKDKIRRLGDVNVNAIEDFKVISEEYTTMKTQYDDLKQAEEQLLGIIEQLDTAMRTQFKEKFSEITVEFDKVFKEMFGGGKGTLELMEDEDILEAGIKIIAQPPGKKLQNMMQLSGGEKALSAIALLFAIQNLKPSPFCLLDEIEAALDESNVGRFAGYLHKLTKHTQFIVITHRRGTMERSDRLYGITMQEKGISTLVSVDLIDNKDIK